MAAGIIFYQLAVIETMVGYVATPTARDSDLGQQLVCFFEDGDGIIFILLRQVNSRKKTGSAAAYDDYFFVLCQEYGSIYCSKV
jgi:hypothetical protein